MIPVKVQCGCGQRYAFDVDPIDGHMPAPVKCPVCGADGTLAANELIAQALGAQPVAAAPIPAVAMAAVAPTGGIRLATPPPPASASAPSPPPLPVTPARASAFQKPSRGRDGWATDESSFNKLGSYVTLGPPIFAAMLSVGMFGIQIPPATLGMVVGICGLVGGAINIAGRGPLIAGAFVGMVMALGGYLAVYWWMQGKESVRKYEAAIALIVGAIPGFLLQYALQAMLRKRAAS